MKKQSVAICLSAFIIIALVGMITFVFWSSPSKSDTTVDVTGTWKVAAYFSEGNHTLADNEFIVFTESNASLYREGSVAAVSVYTISDGAKLTLPELSKEYTVERLTDNYIRLCAAKGVYTDLIRYPNDDLSEAPVDLAMVPGTWSVVYRTIDVPVEELLVFTETTIEDYRNGSPEPSDCSTYSWVDKNCLLAEKWGLEIEILQLSANDMFCIETQTGLVWDLHRIP